MIAVYNGIPATAFFQVLHVHIVEKTTTEINVAEQHV